MILKLKSHVAPFIDSPTPTTKWVRIAIAIVYLTILTMVLIQSSANPLLGPAAPREYNLAWEIFLTAGHLIGFSLLVVMIWSALTTVTTSRRALVTAVIFACLLGLITEMLQSFVPDRSASFFDLACDCGVAFASAFLIHRLYP